MAEPERPPDAVRPAGAGPGAESGERLHADAWSPRPDEELRFCFFEGLLETRAGARADHDAAADALGRLGLGEVKLDVDGRRARVMLEEGAVAGSKLDDRARTRFLACLQEFLEAAGEPRQAESTLRCTEVFRTVVRETLFQPLRGGVEPVCRVRPKVPADEARAPRGLDARRGVAGLEARTIAILLALLLVGFAASAWSSGWVDRVLAQDAAELQVESGPFAGLLDVRLRRDWGKYVVEVRRGERYPADPAAAQAVLDAAETTAERACIGAVVDGDDVYVLLESASGETLSSERFSLRPLVAREDAVVEAKLWGRMAARTVRLSLEDGRRGTGSK